MFKAGVAGAAGLTAENPYDKIKLNKKASDNLNVFFNKGGDGNWKNF